MYHSAQLTSKRLLAGRTTAQLGRPLASTSFTSSLSTRAGGGNSGGHGRRPRERNDRQQYLLQRVVPQRNRRALSQTPPNAPQDAKEETSLKGIDAKNGDKTSSEEDSSDKAPKQGAPSSSSSTSSQYQVATGFAGGNPFSSGSSVSDAVLTTVVGIGLGVCVFSEYL